MRPFSHSLARAEHVLSCFRAIRRFRPELLVGTASRMFIALLLELVHTRSLCTAFSPASHASQFILLACFWGMELRPPSYWDLTAYASYKYVA